MSKNFPKHAASAEAPSPIVEGAATLAEEEMKLLEEPLDFDWSKPQSPYDAIKGTRRSSGYATFELNIDKAMAEQFGRFFDSMSTAPLTPLELASVPSGASGAYALYRVGGAGGEELAYIGKSDSKAGLAQRLERHRRKLMNRHGISPGEIRFKACLIYSFAAIDVESMLLSLALGAARSRIDAEHDLRKRDHDELMRAWKQSGKPPGGKPAKLAKKPDAEAPFLNNSGFGSNDTGEKRDGQSPSKFDQTYPLNHKSMVNPFLSGRELADLKIPHLVESPRSMPIDEAVRWFTRAVYFTLRISKLATAALKNSRDRIELRQLFLVGPMDEVLRRLSAQLPGFSIAVFRGKVILDVAGARHDKAVMCFEGGHQLAK